MKGLLIMEIREIKQELNKLENILNDIGRSL